jgi:hypothetical protein
MFTSITDPAFPPLKVELVNHGMTPVQTVILSSLISFFLGLLSKPIGDVIQKAVEENTCRRALINEYAAALSHLLAFRLPADAQDDQPEVWKFVFQALLRMPTYAFYQEHKPEVLARVDKSKGISFLAGSVNKLPELVASDIAKGCSEEEIKRGIAGIASVSMQTHPFSKRQLRRKLKAQMKLRQQEHEGSIR